MPSKTLIVALFVILLSPVQLPAQDTREDDLSIGRMRVMIWPEYDDQSVLMVYDGRFEDDEKFPTVTDFQIPKGAIINDICSLSPDGQHFCQLYETSKGNEFDMIHMSLPFSNFYVSFHFNSINVENPQRNLKTVIRASHPIGYLEVDIQQPLHSTEFTISPDGGNPSVEKDFNHFGYTRENLAKGDEVVFGIDYVKNTEQPSVDVIFANMTESRVWGSPYQTQRRVMTIVYSVFGSGIFLIGAAGFWLWRKSGKKREA